MQDEKRVEEPVHKPAKAAQPKNTWQKPRVQQLRISLDTAASPGSATDGLGGSLPF